jgi:hypothetical protein
MSSLAIYDIKVPYDGTDSMFFSFKEAVMEKLSELKLFHIFHK